MELIDRSPLYVSQNRETSYGGAFPNTWLSHHSATKEHLHYIASNAMISGIVLTKNNVPVVTRQPGYTSLPPPPTAADRPLQEDYHFFASIVLSFLCCFFGPLGLCFIIPATVFAVQAREAELQGDAHIAGGKRTLSLILNILGFMAGLVHFGVILASTIFIVYSYIGIRQLNRDGRPLRTPPPPYSAETPLYNGAETQIHNSPSRPNQVVTSPPGYIALPQRTPQYRPQSCCSCPFFLSFFCCLLCCCFGQIGLCCIVPACVYAIQARKDEAHGETKSAAEKHKLSLMLNMVGFMAGLIQIGVILALAITNS